MAEQKKKKYTKVGTVLDGKWGKFITLGDEKNPKADYKFDVQIRVTKADGTIVQVKNGSLKMMDPRKRPGITEEQAAKIPESIVSELFITQDE